MAADGSCVASSRACSGRPLTAQGSAPRPRTTAPWSRRKPGALALTTDSYVVQPLFFPGGDIGHLAVYGTVNDLAMAGAKPEYLTARLHP